MPNSVITHSDIVAYADDKVNLKREYVRRYRDQVGNVRNHIERYINEHPDTGLVKTQLSGSLAKSTALRSLNDIDVAIYVKADVAPRERDTLLDWLVEQLRKTYPQKDPSDIQIDDPCVTINFKGTGLDIDLMPIYDEGDGNGKGYIWSRLTGDKILTSIPMHIDFIRTRNAKLNKHFTQVIRLVKTWAKRQREINSNFLLPSFILELLAARLADVSVEFSDYPETLRSYFAYIVTSELKEPIIFFDNYSATDASEFNDHPIRILDPVNPENNVAKGISEFQRITIVETAEEALEAITYAQRATTQGQAKECWRDIFGPSFN